MGQADGLKNSLKVMLSNLQNVIYPLLGLLFIFFFWSNKKYLSLQQSLPVGLVINPIALPYLLPVKTRTAGK